MAGAATVAGAERVGLRTLGRAVVWGSLYFVPFVVWHALTIPGWCWTVAGAELWMIGPMLCLCALFGAMLGFAWKPWSRIAEKVATWSLGVLVATVPAVMLSAKLRTWGFALAAERAAPLVHAIERHVQDQGAAPVTLSALVPRYLDALPSGLPALQIVVGDEAREVYGGNDWALRAPVPSGLINWDEFLYFPNGAYPERGFGGWLERVGAWAYVHE